MMALRSFFGRRRPLPVVPVDDPSPVSPAPEASPVPRVPPAPRRRSQKRQRVKTIAVHLTPDEYAAVTAKAAAAGLPAGGFLRQCGLGAPTPRTPRRATLDDTQRAEVLSALHRTGNNLNQMARALNRGDAVPGDALTAALRQYAGAVNLLMHAATPAVPVPAPEVEVSNDR